jgi:hypothetical protein
VYDVDDAAAVHDANDDDLNLGNSNDASENEAGEGARAPGATTTTRQDSPTAAAINAEVRENSSGGPRRKAGAPGGNTTPQETNELTGATSQVIIRVEGGSTSTNLAKCDEMQ